MASWASVAKASPAPAVPTQDLTADSAGLRLLVVDANAIISGLHLEGIADRAVTIQEVFDEIRDKKSLTRFARETGDVSALSSNDIKLLALAHTLEVAAYGSQHLHAHPSQNVLLQMGLRLLTRDGRRIARLSRYALRCSACFTVTREAGRLFCPKCGNLSLDRVEVVVGPNGAEYYGARKRHILRGTKFSLPKPRGGRNSRDPVLREDIFLLKVKALGKKRASKNTTESAAGGVAALSHDLNQDNWHSAAPSQRELAQHRGLASVLQPSWKNNPNERKLTRSNRRG
eukprot:gene13406-13534_t